MSDILRGSTALFVTRVALSYIWYDPTPLIPLRLGDREVYIGDNFAEALEKLR